MVYQRIPKLSFIIADLIAQGATPVMIGGSVRDFVLYGLEYSSRDYDIEVYHCSLEILQKILEGYGVVRLVGKSFGILMIDGIPVDWSVPRIDDAGRKPHVHIDMHMTYAEAFARRDLTFNAIGIDCITGELLDPYHGVADLQARIARAPNLALFVQDPLRLLRVARFVSCLDVTVDSVLSNACRGMSLDQISTERIGFELAQLIQGAYPSKGLRWLHTIGQLSHVLPELALLAGVCQSPVWHPEGDALEHSFQAIDAAARIASLYDTVEKKMIFLYATLFHDIGKKETTRIHDDGKITSYHHATVGAKLVVSLLQRFHVSKTIIEGVRLLVYYHMHLGQYIKTGARIAAYKWLAHALHPFVSMRMLLEVMTADLQGRNADTYKPLLHSFDTVEECRALLIQHNIYEQPEPALLHAIDLLPLYQGKMLGDQLKKAYQLQIDCNISDKAALYQMLTKRAL